MANSGLLSKSKMRKRGEQRRSKVNSLKLRKSSPLLSKKSKLCKSHQRKEKRKQLQRMVKRLQQELKRRFLFEEMNSLRSKERERLHLQSSKKIDLR